jgi:hypothetical protein
MTMARGFLAQSSPVTATIAFVGDIQVGRCIQFIVRRAGCLCLFLCRRLGLDLQQTWWSIWTSDRLLSSFNNRLKSWVDKNQNEIREIVGTSLESVNSPAKMICVLHADDFTNIQLSIGSTRISQQRDIVPSLIQIKLAKIGIMNVS